MTHCVGVRVKEIRKVTVLVNVWGIETGDIVLWLIMRRCHYVDFEGRGNGACYVFRFQVFWYVNKGL